MKRVVALGRAGVESLFLSLLLLGRFAKVGGRREEAGFANSRDERESVLVEAEEFRRWEEFHRGARRFRPSWNPAEA